MKQGRTLENIMSNLPKERQKRIQEMADIDIREYKSLQSFRKALGITQKDIAGELMISQVNISKLEGRKDMHLSTLRKYVEAMGCKLEINIRLPDSNQARLDNLPI